ncbi:hypothetical protein DA01_03575 [Dehalococcoides mccartyi]|uniref:Uncharacterized protein n=1 Tax=Dehalococcoides mccartyi TaxID=61435 RepID=A0A0V8LXX2_9CHLR|nr:hypothetical protein [Dehalococcoides mccartyi]KSV16332.1 hypothetical protein DA01_03575 [Dehalococcoides mccartyi]
MTGIELIAEERKRQIEVEGFNAEHDDDVYHESGELALAAACYASPINLYQCEITTRGTLYSDPWPNLWEGAQDKRKRRDPWFNIIEPNGSLPSTERIRNLVKAGALVAAEIDRLQREQQNESH